MAASKASFAARQAKTSSDQSDAAGGSYRGELGVLDPESTWEIRDVAEQNH